MKKFLSLGVFLLIFTFPQMRSVDASCGVPSFEWNFRDAEGVYEVEVLDKTVYDTIKVILTDQDLEYDMTLHEFDLKNLATFKGDRSVGDTLTVRETANYEENPIVMSHDGHTKPMKWLSAEQGDIILIRLLKHEGEGSEDYVLDSNDPCDLPNFYIDTLIEGQGLEDYEFLKENGYLLETEGSTFKEYITYNFLHGVDLGFENPFYEFGVYEPMPDFLPDQNIERLDVVELLYRAAGFEFEYDPLQSKERSYVDVPGLGSWPYFNFDASYSPRYEELGNIYYYHGFISRSIYDFTQMGIISGYSDGTFRPNNPITRAEATKIIVNVLREIGQVDENATYIHNFPDVDESNKFLEYISILNTIDVGGEKIMQGYSDGTFRPDQNITRGEFSKIAALIHQL